MAGGRDLSRGGHSSWSWPQLWAVLAHSGGLRSPIQARREVTLAALWGASQPGSCSPQDPVLPIWLMLDLCPHWPCTAFSPATTLLCGAWAVRGHLSSLRPCCLRRPVLWGTGSQATLALGETVGPAALSELWHLPRQLRAPARCQLLQVVLALLCTPQSGPASGPPRQESRTPERRAGGWPAPGGAGPCLGRKRPHRWVHVASGCELHLTSSFFKRPTLGGFT